MLNKYNPKKLAGNWGGIRLIGYMTGTFFEVEYDEDAATIHVGSDGTVSVLLNANQTAKAKVTIVQGSSTNDDLRKKVPSAKLNTLPVDDFLWSDLNGNTVVHSDKAFLLKMTPVKFGNEILGREWTFILPEAEINPGGATQ